MKLFLVRHGESLGNKLGMIQGHLNLDLSPEGYIQAEKIGARLKEIKFDKIYTSKLRRAYNTADNINKYHNLTILTNSNLNEQTYGIEEGILWNNIDPERHNLAHNDMDFKFDAGESINDLFERVKLFYNEIINNSDNKGKNILIVSHKRTMKALLELVHNKNQVEIKSINSWNPKNTSLFIINLENFENPLVELNNCIKHLE